MGHLDDPLNTFWQLFFLPPGGRSWSNQVEATAVATNGGLVLAPSAGRSLAVGIRPSNQLTFSPVIATANGGRSWSNGLIPQGLAASPDALAAGPSGQAVALVGNHRQHAGAHQPRRSRQLAAARDPASAGVVAGGAGLQPRLVGRGRLRGAAGGGGRQLRPTRGGRTTHPSRWWLAAGRTNTSRLAQRRHRPGAGLAVDQPRSGHAAGPVRPPPAPSWPRPGTTPPRGNLERCPRH